MQQNIFQEYPQKEQVVVLPDKGVCSGTPRGLEAREGEGRSQKIVGSLGSRSLGFGVQEFGFWGLDECLRVSLVGEQDPCGQNTRVLGLTFGVLPENPQTPQQFRV